MSAVFILRLTYNMRWYAMSAVFIIRLTYNTRWYAMSAVFILRLPYNTRWYAMSPVFIISWLTTRGGTPCQPCVYSGSHTTRCGTPCRPCVSPGSHIYERNLFHSFQIETANSFYSLDLSESIEIKSPISDFEPVLHSSPIIDRRHWKKIKNWRTVILNCQRLRGKVEAFQSSVDYFQPDCILGTESSLDKSVFTNEIFPPGYEIFRRDRITSTQGGGEFIAVKENYDVSLLPDTVTDTEFLWAKVHFEKSKSLILGSFYRPPGSKIKKMEEFSRSLDLLTKNSNQTIILGGDFNNLPDIYWENSLVLPSATNKGQCEHLLSSLNDHALTQVQKEPTRDKNILDLCITNKPGLLKSSRSVPGISDHCAVLTESDLNPPYRRATARQVRQFKKASWENIRQEIRRHWASFSKDSPNHSVIEKWLRLKSILMDCLNKFVPTKLPSKRHNLPWLNKLQNDLTFRQNINYRNGTRSETSGEPVSPLLT